MLHNHERLLVKLIDQHYGLIPSLVAKLLLNHSSILMKRALEYTELSQHDFKRGIEVLSRCNLVTITSLTRHKLIEIHNEKIVNLLYYPYYLVVINKRFGVETVSLLKTLILYGNLSPEDLIERTLLHIIQTNALDVVEEQMKLFISALNEKYEELCVKRIIVLPDQDSGSPQSCNIDLVFQSLSKRFGKNATTKDVRKTSNSNLCTFDCDVLNYLLFIELFPYFANQPFPNEEASFVFKLLLEMTFEKSFVMTETALPYREIYPRYVSSYPALKMTQLSTILRSFSHFFAPDFIKCGDSKSECSLNFNAFLFDIVKIIAKEFVKKNFGENSVRIFGALLEKPCVFENNLLTSLKMDTKELHRNLYQLDLNRIININYYSEASQSASFSARNVKKTFSVNLHEVVLYILNRCYYSLYTMMHRKHIELEDQRDLISRKTYIENYKKEITEQDDEQDEQVELIKTAHNYMSQIDHTKAESLIAYDCKVNKVAHNLINYIFILNMWKTIADQEPSPYE